jgi:hypothetical protein
MGANATTFVPAYVSGEVLTAADLTVTNSGIPVFADSTARDAAFGGTGEKTLAEGQYAFLEDTNATQVYDGATWQAVGASGLTLLAAVTFTSQTTVAFANSLFSASYRNYLVYLECDPDATGGSWTMQLRTNAGAQSAASYIGGLIGYSIFSSVVGISNNNTTSYNLGSATTDNNNIVLTVFNPFANDRKCTWSGTVYNNVSSDLGGAFGGTYQTAVAATGLQFNFANAVTGTYRVYGLADA